MSESAPLLFLEKGLLFMSGNKCSPFSTMSDEGRTFIVESCAMYLSLKVRALLVLESLFIYS